MKNLLLLVVVMSMGCSNMNIQLAGLRGSGDTSVAILLDETSIAKLAERKVEVKNIAEALDKFMSDGKVADLTASQLKDELMRLVPDNLKSIVESAIGFISTKEVNVGKIGKNNVLRIRAYLKGIINGTDLYLDEFHPIEE